MESQRERIARAIAEALENGPGKPAGLNIHRFRTRPIASDRLPAQVIAFEAEDARVDTHGPTTERQLRVRIQSRVRVPSGIAPDEALDPLLTYAIRTLHTDPGLRSLVTSLEEVGTAWDAIEMENTYAAAEQTFRVEYATAEDDPTRPA